jgi:hypothetical protein
MILQVGIVSAQSAGRGLKGEKHGGGEPGQLIGFEIVQLNEGDAAATRALRAGEKEWFRRGMSLDGLRRALPHMHDAPQPDSLS